MNVAALCTEHVEREINLRAAISASIITVCVGL